MLLPTLPPRLSQVDVIVAYKMVAARENQTIRNERSSALITLANARVWASEGWQVTITDADGREFDPAGFEGVLAETNPSLLQAMRVPAPPEQSEDQALEATDQAAEATDHALRATGRADEYDMEELIDTEDVIDEEDMLDEDVNLAPEAVA
jgi:hypothetical protein